MRRLCGQGANNPRHPANKRESAAPVHTAGAGIDCSGAIFRKVRVPDPGRYPPAGPVIAAEKARKTRPVRTTDGGKPVRSMPNIPVAAKPLKGGRLPAKRMVIQVLGKSTPGVIGSIKVIARHLARDPLVTRLSMERNEADDLLNLHIATGDPDAVWDHLDIRLKDNPGIRRYLASRWIVICEGEHGWRDYRVFAHVDRRVRRDPPA